MADPTVSRSETEAVLEVVNPSVSYEPEDVRVRPIFGFLGGLILAILLSLLAMWLIFRVLASRETGEITVSPVLQKKTATQFPEPQLQGSPGHEDNPQDELRQVLGAAEAKLNSYGWVDQQAGIARIPIQEAMRLMLSQQPPAGVNPSSNTQPAKGSNEQPNIDGAAQPNTYENQPIYVDRPSPRERLP